LSETWRVTFARPELAGLIAPERIPEALALPLYWTGLTADRLLSYVATMQLGAVPAWTELALHQTSASKLRHSLFRAAESLGAPAEERFRGLRFLRAAQIRPTSGRFDAERELERFGAALAGVGVDHPVLRALGATTRDFRRAGVPVYVYVNPVNVDNLEAIGVLDRAALARTLASVESVVTTAGGRYSDFHALLPDAGFRDPAGHFSDTGDVDGAQILALAIADAIAATFEEDRPIPRPR
jgi:hypothetical protein